MRLSRDEKGRLATILGEAERLLIEMIGEDGRQFQYEFSDWDGVGFSRYINFRMTWSDKDKFDKPVRKSIEVEIHSDDNVTLKVLTRVQHGLSSKPPLRYRYSNSAALSALPADFEAKMRAAYERLKKRQRRSPLS